MQLPVLFIVWNNARWNAVASATLIHSTSIFLTTRATPIAGFDLRRALPIALHVAAAWVRGSLREVGRRIALRESPKGYSSTARGVPDGAVPYTGTRTS